jgi:cytochrome c oxidase assembly protein subunit 15
VLTGMRRWTGLLLGVELVQIAIGLWQARTGLPIALVNIHMMLAVTLVAAMTAVILHMKQPRDMLDAGDRSTAIS